MNEYDLLRAIGDINEKYIENAVVEEEREPKRRKVHGMIAVAVTLVVLASIGIVTFWALQKEKGNSDRPSKLGMGIRLVCIRRQTLVKQIRHRQ